MHCLLLQDIDRAHRFFHQRGILLRHLVHLGDGAVDFLDAHALLFAGAGDRFDHVGHALDTVDDVLHGAARVFGQLGAGVDAFDRFIDQCLDFARGGGTALGQVAHLGGDHGKAATLFAGPGRFHGRVQGQDIGLEGDAVDDADDLFDLARRRVDGVHGLHHLADDLAALAGHAGGFARQLAGVAGAVGILLDGGGQLFHCRRGFFQ